jgi:hypothetical protein
LSSSTHARRRGFTLREHLAAFAVFAAVTLVFFFPLLKGDTLSDAGRRQALIYPWASLGTGDSKPVVHYDLADAFYPWQAFMNRAARGGELPHWDPYSFGGHPFLASGTNGFLYPPRTALSLVVSPARVHDLLLLTHFFFAGVAMFLFLGVARLSFPAALVGGVAWMVNSFALSWQVLDHYIAIEVWLPVAMLLAHVALRRRRWWAAFALAVALGLLFLAGIALFVELAAVAVFAYGLTLVVSEGLRDRSSIAGNASRLAVAMSLFAAMTAVTSISTLRLSAGTARQELTYDELHQFSLPFRSLMNILYPVEIAASTSLYAYHVNLFAGTAIALLAILGVWRRDLVAGFAAVVGFLTILFMLHTPVTFVLSQLVPGFDNFKPLPRGAFLLQFSLAVLAAFGLEQVLARLRRLPPEPVAFGRRVSISNRQSAAIVVTVTAVVVSVVAQSYRLADFLMPYQPNEQRLLLPSTPLIRFLQREPEARSLATDPSFLGSTAVIHLLRTAGGYDNLAPERTQNFWRAVGNGLSRDELLARPLIYAFYPRYELSKLRPMLLARAAVQYVVIPPRRFSAGEAPTGLEVRYDGPDGRVLAVPGALPRAYVVGGCDAVPDAWSAFEAFHAVDFAATETVILEQQFLERSERSCSADTSGRAGNARVIRRSLNSVDIGVEAQRAAWLVVTETWDRDWHATMNGRRTAVLPANYIYRAIRVPAGSTLVRLTYEPATFRAGAVVSLLAFASALIGLSVALVRQRRLDPGRGGSNRASGCNE